MDSLRFSIVVPSFQQGQFLQRTLDSVLSQNYKNLEVIVQDGGSTDGSVEILKTYQNQIVWSSHSDGGQAEAINRGMQIATGDAVGYLNSDDILLPGALTALNLFFQNNPHVEFAYGLADLIGDSDRIIGIYPVESWDYQRLLETCYICQPACFWRRSAMAKYGAFDETLHFAFDYDYWLKAGKVSSFGFIPKKIAAARRHSQAKTIKRRSDSFEESFRVICKYSKPHLPRRWILALAQARAEVSLQTGLRSPLNWSKFIQIYCKEANALAKQHPISEPLNLTSSILPHCINAFKKLSIV